MQNGFSRVARTSRDSSARVAGYLWFVTLVSVCLISPALGGSALVRDGLTLTLAGLEVGDRADAVHDAFPDLVLSDRPYRHPAYGESYAMGDRLFVAEQVGFLQVKRVKQHQLVEARLTGDGRLYLFRISTHGQIICDDVYEQMAADYGKPFLAGRGYAVWSSTPVQLNGRLELRCLDDGGVRQTLLDQQLQDRYLTDLRERAEKRMRRKQPHPFSPHF